MTSTVHQTLQRIVSGSVVAGALLLPACGSANLDLVDEPTPPAPIVNADGCDAHPELPSPVKVLLLVDVSGSLQFTDQAAVRLTALRSFVDRLAAQGAQVATMGFGANVYVAPTITGPNDALFIPASEWTEPEFLGVADVQTDLEGALAAARMHLKADMDRTELNELARTRYVTMLFTDGAPSPTCCVEGAERINEAVSEFDCPLEPWEQEALNNSAANTVYCGAYTELALCNDIEYLERFQETNQASSWLPNYGEGYLKPINGLAAGGNYNRRDTLQDAARLIGALTQDGVGAVNMHAFMLADPTLPDEVKAVYRLNTCNMQRTIDTVATEVSGTAQLFASSLAIDFSSVDTTPLCE